MRLFEVNLSRPTNTGPSIQATDTRPAQQSACSAPVNPRPRGRTRATCQPAGTCRLADTTAACFDEWQADRAAAPSLRFHAPGSEGAGHEESIRWKWGCRERPRGVVAIKGVLHQAELVALLWAGAMDHDVVIVESIGCAYSRIKQLAPDLVVVMMGADDVPTCQLLQC
jgi:hypothetical protein